MGMDDPVNTKTDPESDSGRQAGRDRSEQGMTDKWTVRGISQETRRHAMMLARAADQPIGAWLTTLIANAPDKSDRASDIATLVARVERIERAVFPPDKADMTDASGGPTSLPEPAANPPTPPQMPNKSVLSDNDVEPEFRKLPDKLAELNNKKER